MNSKVLQGSHRFIWHELFVKLDKIISQSFYIANLVKDAKNHPIWVLFGCPERNLWSCIIKIKLGCPWSLITHHIADSFFIISNSAHTYDLLTLSAQESVQCNLVISCFSVKRNESRDNFERIKQAASQCQHAVSLEYSVLSAQTKLVLELWIPHTLVYLSVWQYLLDKTGIHVPAKVQYTNHHVGVGHILLWCQIDRRIIWQLY